MQKLLLKLWCLTVLVAGMAACSHGEDEVDIYADSQKNDSTDKNSFNGIGPTVANNLNLQKVAGKYTGMWWMNDVKTEADNIFYLFMEKASQRPDVLEYNKNVSPSYVWFYFHPENATAAFDFKEFPFKAIAKQLFPDIDIAYITQKIMIGGQLDSEEMLLFNFSIEAENSGLNNICRFYSIPLRMIGYSDKIVYYDFKPAVGAAYLQLPYVVTTKDGNYFAIVLNLVADQCSVSMDTTTKTMTCKFFIKQIEIYDKDFKKTEQGLNKETILTFISTQKIE